MAVKIKRINEYIYNTCLNLIIGEYFECRKYIERHHKFEFDERHNPDTYVVPAMALSWLTLKSNNKKVYYLWIPSWTFDREHFSDLSHEIFHLAILIADDIGMNINYQTGEPICYYTRYMFSEAVKILEDLFWDQKPDYKPCKPAMEYMTNATKDI